MRGRHNLHGTTITLTERAYTSPNLAFAEMKQVTHNGLRLLIVATLLAAAAFAGDETTSERQTPLGMVWIPGGEFSMGSELPDSRANGEAGREGERRWLLARCRAASRWIMCCRKPRRAAGSNALLTNSSGRTRPIRGRFRKPNCCPSNVSSATLSPANL